MNWFFDIIDLGENLKRGLNAVRTLHGLPALLTAIPLALVSFLFLALAWHFDLKPTYVWTDIAVQKLQPTFAGQLAGYIGLLVFTLTMLPTLIELFTVRFAQYNITMAQWLVYFFVVFDMTTDWPAASDFVEGYVASGVFERLGFLATPAIYLAKIGWLLFASFGFEMLGVVFAVCALALLLNSSRRPHQLHTV